MTIASWVSPDALENSTSDLAPSAVSLASRILWSLTGRIYGGQKTTTEVYLPAVASSDPLLLYTLAQYQIGVITRYSPMQVGLNGQIRIPLRRRPVIRISNVQTVAPSGQAIVIDPSKYFVSSSTYLTVEPVVPTLVGLEVTYLYGMDPPADGVNAARALADELIMLMTNTEDGIDTRLKNVTGFTRNGVNIQIEDARTILTDGRTGIPEVDLFVASVNPTRSKMRSRIISPDGHFPR